MDPHAELRREQRAAAESGRRAAVTARLENDLLECVGRHPELFDDPRFGPVPGRAAAANVYGTPPGCAAADLKIAGRLTMWVFAADWQIDHLATAADVVRKVVDGSLATADGAAPGTPLSELLAEIIDELATAPRWPDLRPVWREELARMLAAAEREWRWKASGAVPSLDGYLDNSDNFASTLVNVAHWIYTDGGGEPATFDHLAELRAASREVQRVLRLLNDQATYHRDLRWGELGDLNALMLADAATVQDRIAELTAGCQEMLGALAGGCPGQAAYLSRQLGFSAGFYAGADYWGT